MKNFPKYETSKQSHLLPRPAELRTIQLPAFLIQSILLRVSRILLRHELRVIPFAAHADSEARVVDLAVVAGFDEVPDLVGPVGEALV